MSTHAFSFGSSGRAVVRLSISRVIAFSFRKANHRGDVLFQKFVLTPAFSPDGHAGDNTGRGITKNCTRKFSQRAVSASVRAGQA
ncbi:hypothetical protein [Rhizobium nepotum]|uniref:hypothetical protein n=1 Tax=Rhizobium nepotum TaxID=1035271 RepID=UPI003CEE4A60